MRTVNNDTPFLYACEHGHEDIVQYLVQDGNCDFGMFITTSETISLNLTSLHKDNYAHLDTVVDYNIVAT